MHVTVDTSVLIAVIANEPTKQALVEATRGAALVAPASVHWEIGNALSAMLKRGRIGLRQARRTLVAYGEIPVRFVDVDLLEAIELAGRLEIYAYDAYILICAREHRCPLLSLDDGLVRAAEKLDLAVMEVPES